MADYIMQDIEVSSTGSHDYDPEGILGQSYDIDISKCKSFFLIFERSPLLPIYSMMNTLIQNYPIRKKRIKKNQKWD